MKKGLLLLFLIVSLLAVSSVMAASLADTLEKVGEKILEIGSLKFLLGGGADNQFFGFVRISLGILIFSVLYMGLNLIPNMDRTVAITVGVILAIISAVFTPASILAAFGATYATLFAFIFVGGPIIGVLYLLFVTPTRSRAIAGVKLIVLTMLLLLVNEISHWAIILANAP